MVFTMLTTLWSTKKVRERQQSRRRNQSEQIKAMWRVEERHFNPLMNSNYMMKGDTDSNVGGFNSNQQTDEKNKKILNRIMQIME